MMPFHYKGTSLLPQQCEICEKCSDLLRCSGCQVAYYCGRDHQTVDRDNHKRACVGTKKARTEFSQQETLLRNNPGDGFMVPPRVFEDYVGRFWGLLGTRDYMRARFNFIDTMLNSFPRHRVAVQTALDHLMDMMRLNRSDNMGLRDMAPSLMLRLGRDQDAYDFVKWWATCDPDGRYDWGDMELPFLNTKAADVLEEPRWWTDEYLDLSHAAVVTLIKLRTLSKLRDLQNTARAFQAGTLPCEIVDRVREVLLDDSPLEKRWSLAATDTATLAAMIEKVKKQIWALFRAVRKANKHFWALMISTQAEDGAGELQRPEYYSSGSSGEANLLMLYNYPAWEETPGAVDEIETVWWLYMDEVHAASSRDASFGEEDGFSDNEEEGVFTGCDFFYDGS